MDADDLKLQPRAFRRDHVPTAPDQELAGLVFVLDAQAQAIPVQRLRSWADERLAPRAGEIAVDVGSGTGDEVIRLAGLVGPTGRSVGIEPHPGLRAEAERRAAAAGSAAEFVDAEASALPFDDGTVDVLRSERVFQHLLDPQAAATEFARVLAPGGRVAILDSDWATSVMTPGDPDVVERVNRTMLARTANPFAGRHLRGQLTRAGLAVDPDVGSAALVISDEILPFLMANMLAEAIEAGSITSEEAETLKADVTAGVATGETFVSVTMFAVVATKPASASV